MPASQFWNLVHQISEAQGKTGQTADERTRALLAAFGELPPTLKWELLADVMHLSMDLPDLYAAMMSVANIREQQGEDRKFWPKGNSA